LALLWSAIFLKQLEKLTARAFLGALGTVLGTLLVVMVK
jgi:hypothetical protein